MLDFCITSECTCDLPLIYLNTLDVDILYNYIYTDSGRFRDTSEITAVNLLDYMKNGGQKTISQAPTCEDFYEFFKEKLKTFNEVLHITISSKISEGYACASKAIEMLGEDGKRIHLFDTCHLSTGIAHFIIKAYEMKKSSASIKDILLSLEELRPLVSTTFITENADYLYRNQKVSEAVKNICNTFGVHPVLYMNNGNIKLKRVFFGDYENACKKYIRKELKRGKAIDCKRLFITHVGCTLEKIQKIRGYCKKLCEFNEVRVTTASATIASNCGPNTFGVLFVKSNNPSRIWKGTT